MTSTASTSVRAADPMIEKIVAAKHSASAQEIVNCIFDAVRDFCQGCDPFDDETVVVVKIKTSAAAIAETTRKRSRRTDPSLRSV